MKRSFAVAIIIGLFLSASALVAQHQHGSSQPATQQSAHTMTGVVTDTMCGKTHMLPGKTDAECVRECVRSGSKYALQVGDKTYTLNGDSKKIDPFAGKKVKVSGEMKGDTVTVSSIAEAK